MKHEPIPSASDPIKQLSTRERAIAAVKAAFPASAPVDPFELDRRKAAMGGYADDAAKPNMSREDWTGASSYPGVL